MKYEKKDFVKCDRKSQIISKGHGKVGISTEKLRQDEQWTYSCRLAASRGKAMTILIDEKGEFSDIDEVLVVVGPTFDILIKFNVEDDEITREVFVENYVQHVEGRYGKRGNTMCITVPVEERDKRFILDSGSGHDLISSTRISRMDLPTYDDKTVNFHTANGVTSSTKRSSIPFDAFNEPAEAHILEDTPSVISMGKRCVDLGYSFVWPAGKTPFMLDSNGNIIEMAVKDYIPYVSVDQEKRKIRSSCVEKIMAALDDDCSTSDGEGLMVIDGESGDELEDLSDIVGRSNDKSPKMSKKKKKKRKSSRSKSHQHEAAVGSDADDVEEELYPVDDYAEFDDDDGYAPSLGPDGADVDELDDEHRVEVEEVPEGGDGEDNDDVIDVDEEDGGVRLSKRGTLKNEARSKVHLLTHRYKNPYCESCVRAKMKHRKTFRGAFQRKLTKFGDLVTFDYVDNRRIAEQDYGDDKTIFVIRDRYTGMLQSYPSARKDTNAVITAVKQFMGRRKIREAYSDDAPQFEKAMKIMRIPMDTSLAGKTKHNSLAERTNQFVLVATTTCLLEAGIPPCFWMYAIRCVSHLLNIEPNDDEVSSWCKLHGEEFKGKMIPFGALVYFKPSGSREREQQHKFDPMGIPGVFAGYSIGPGLHWSRKYRVWALCDWSKQNLAYDTEKPIAKLRTPHYTERVELKEPLEFPCKAEYERINVSIEGLKVKDRLDGNPEILPPPPPDEDDDDEDGGGDDDGHDGGGVPSSGVPREPTAGELEAEAHLEEMSERLGLGPPGIDKPAHPDLHIPEGGPEHYSVGKAGDGIVYLNDDGEWVKLNARGHPYRIDERGFRRISTTPRPSKYTPDEWRKMSPTVRKGIAKAEEKKIEAEEEKKKIDAKIKESEARAKKKAEKKKEKVEKKSKSSKKSDKDDHVSGVAMPQDHIRKGKIIQYGKGVSSPIGREHYAAAPCNSELSDTDVPDDDDFLMDWDEWSEIENGRGPRATWDKDKMYDFNQGKVVAAATVINAGHDPQGARDDVFQSFPCMPCVNHCGDHREKLTSQVDGININKMFNTVVARPVGRKEMMENDDARKAMRKEWLGQHSAGVYDFSGVREYDDVVREAKANKSEVHMARVHGICVEKNYQLPAGSPSRKFKGRGVLLGNQVKNQFWEAAFFQDLGNSPATFEASRWADFYGCLPGHNVKLADAIQAYIQAKLTGPPCWVELPEDAWPDDVNFKKFRRPVVRLVKALYGHPDSGTMWEQHCDQKVRELDFIPVGEEWPSMYFHKKLKLLLVIYVDDLKLAGPEENLTKGWEMLRSKLNIEPETDLGLYLGCILRKGSSKLHDGTPVSTMTYDMEGLLKLSVEKYLDIVGKDTKLKNVSTPSLPEETKRHKSRAPCPGNPQKKTTCPWCAHEFDPDAPLFYDDGSQGKDVSPGKSERGALAPHAASVLMKLLYAARIARFDLLRSINSLARNVTKWTVDDDAKLYHLMCYVNSSLSKRMTGWVGDKFNNLTLSLFADADFAGCAQSLRSTSGSHMHIQGNHTRFPLSGGSKRQGCVSHSTPEAEIVAADTTLRTMGLPAMSIWETLTGKSPKLLFHDDNQGMIGGVVRSGRNPTMRHLERTHGIAITSLHEHFNRENYVLMYEVTSKMAADIHTKGFKNPLAWKRACMLINLLDPGDIGTKDLFDMVSPTTNVDTTVRQVFQTKTQDVPNFPYTEIPILPPEVYQKGLSGKEQVQQLPGMDPILVVKTPTFFRKRPPGVSLPHGCLRSTWILSHGKWIKVEDRVPPVQQQERFDQWVERACFQYHPCTPSIPPSVVVGTQAGIVPSGHPASPVRPGLHAAAVPTRQTHVRKYPQLTVGVDQLFCHQSLGTDPVTIHAAPYGAARVINTLLRVVHGGSSGWGSLPTGFPPSGDPNDDPYPTENQDPKKRSIVFAGGDSFAGRVSRDRAYNPENSTRKGKRVLKDETNVDEWIWKDETTLVRVHKVPRRKMFTPKEADFLPCKLKRFRDERETNQMFQSSGRLMHDSWRLAGNNIEKTNKRNEFWTGTTTFKIISNADIDDVMDSGSDVEDRASCQDTVVTCIFDGNMNIIPLDDMFIAHHYDLKHETRQQNDWDIKMVLHRKNGKTLTYHFRQSYSDLLGKALKNKIISLNLYEMRDDVPCLLLMCAETQSIITKVHKQQRFKMMHVVTITEDDNLLSNYGRAKWRRCIRGPSDCVFFAGPCTGGSPWNRLNKNVSEITAHNIRMKALLFWELRNEFAVCLQRVHILHAMALLELPRGCDYWNDERMKSMIDGTQSTVHDFDGCMYGLTSKFKDVGMPIKKPWRVVSWGVHFFDLHEKCDGSHAHGQCAGRETRVTQMYTDQIVRSILRGITNQMLINNVYGKKFRPKVMEEEDYPGFRSCPCMIVNDHQDELMQKIRLDQLFTNFIKQRGGEKVKLRLILHRGTAGADPDPVQGSWKVKRSCISHRESFLVDPDPSCLSAATAMATSDLVIPSAAKGVNLLKTTLSLVKQKQQERSLPTAFSTYEESNWRGCPERDIDEWIGRVQIAPPIVIALAFVMDRSDRVFVTHAVRLLMKMLMKVVNEGELNSTVTSFIDKGARLCKLVEQAARSTEDGEIMKLLCTEECAVRIDEFWETLRDHYSGQNSMITREITVKELRDKIANTSPVSLGSLNQTFPPPGSICQQIRMRTNFEDIARRKWERWSFEALKAEAPDGDEVEKRMNILVGIMYEESYGLGYALRRHNARMASSQGKKIIVQNVLEDWMSMSYNLSLERTAAVVHLQTILMVSKMLHEWLLRFENVNQVSHLCKVIKMHLDKMKQAIDLRSDIWELGGYNIEKADQGMFDDVEMRNRTFSCIRDYITTTASTQSGQTSADDQHIDQWDVPLMPKDGRNPPAQPDHPAWDPSPIRMMTDQQQREADAQRAQHEQRYGSGGPTIGGRESSSSASGSAPPRKAPPAAKARPSTPPSMRDWVIPRVPTDYIFKTSKLPDHRSTDFTTSAWMDETDRFLLSIIQGPSAMAASKTGSAPWAQYLRRVTSYACMVFGICSPAVVTDEEAASIPEKDWLRCYSHIVRKYLLTRTGCYLSTASMLVMLGYHDTDIANASGFGRIKKSITNHLGCKIIDSPTAPRDTDQLAGDFRAGYTVLVTDLMYRVGTQSGAHGIQMGLSDMGWESVMVFRIHDAIADNPLGKFMETLGKVKDYLENEIMDDGQVTVHLWLSLQFLHSPKPPHLVMIENTFKDDFVKEIIDLDQITSRPVIVAVNDDSWFNGMDSMTSRLAVELVEKLRLQGILVTKDPRMWRSMYSQFGKQYPILSTTKKGSLGKTAIWSVIEKNLFRQRVFLRCATNREHVSAMNERAAKPDDSGIDVKVLEDMTGPTEVFAIASGEMTSADYAADDSTIFQKGATPNRFTKDKRFKTSWVEPIVRTHELEPIFSDQCMWFWIDKENEDILCGTCRTAVDMDTIEQCQNRPTHCINCSANTQDHYKRVSPTLEARKSVLLLAARIKVALETCGIDLLDINQGFREWLSATAQSLVSNTTLSYGENLLKSVSHMGGVRISKRQAVEIFRNGRGKQFSIYRERLYDEASKQWILAYRVTKDCGNVAYKDFFEKVAVPEIKERNEIFAFSRASAEKTGDIIEFWLGILDVANMARGVVNIFESNVDPAEFLNGLEQSLGQFTSTSRTTYTVNDKRRGSFDCTLQPAEAEKVMKIIQSIPGYETMNDFDCLTDWERVQVLLQFAGREKAPGDDTTMGTEAEAQAGDESSTQPAKEEAEASTKDPIDVVRDSENSGRQQLLDALGNVFTVSEDVNVCLYCGSTKHAHMECDSAKKDGIKKALRAVRASLEAESPSSGDVEMDDAEQQKDGSGADEEGKQTEDQTKPKVAENHWYDGIRTMSEVGDLDESGKFCIEGRDIGKLGPTIAGDLNEIVRDAIARAGGDTWKVPDFIASYSDTNIRKPHYRRIEAPADGFLKIIPTTGAHFFNYEFHGGIEYAANYKFSTGNRLVGYEDKVSNALNRILRHNVGKVSERLSLPCDDAGWVRIEEVLKCEAIWRQEPSRKPHTYLAPRGRADDRSQWNREEAKYRMELLFRIMFHCARYGRRVREQILAFGISRDIDRRSLTCIDNNVLESTEIPEEGLLLYPVAVRAPTGHKEGTHRNDVVLMSSLLSHPIAPNTALSLPVSFHITKKENLWSIWKEGLIPGGLGEGHRMFTFFNPFAPWDYRSWTLTKIMDTRKGGFACLYIPTEVLMVEYGGRLTDSGQIVTPKIIPFSAIRGGWVQDPSDQANATWHRLIVPSGDDQVVRSGTIRSKRTVTKESILRIAAQCLENEKQPYDETVMDVMNIVHLFNSNQMPHAGQEQYNARIKLIDYIVEKKRVEYPGCRHCPHCLNETPTSLSICLTCWTELESHGLRPYHFQVPDENEDVATQEVIDEAVRKAEESMFNDTVREAGETVPEHDDYGFSMDEVDYNEGEDEEMDQEEETQQDDEIIEEDEDDEMNIEEEKEPEVKLPAWAQNLTPGGKGLPGHGLVNNDVSEAAAYLYDNIIVSKLISMFKYYYDQRIVMTPQRYYTLMAEEKKLRMDLDAFCMYLGEDSEGNLKRPTEGDLDQLFKEKAKKTHWSSGELLYAGRPRNMMMPVIRILEFYEKMMEFLVCAGYTPERLGFLIPMTKAHEDQQAKQEMRVTISNFLRRLLKGAFPDKESYSYFRSSSEGFHGCIELPAFSVYLTLREKEQKIELLVAAQQCGIPLPQCFINKMAYAIKFAEDEANRGHGSMKKNMTPNLGDEMVKEVFKTIGDNIGARQAAEDSKQRAKAQPQQGREEPSAASSSSASVPKAKAKAMPKSYGPSKASPAKPPPPKAAPKRSASGWEPTAGTPSWKKVKRDDDNK